jgi:prepilin-type processing-associated H-X9-DG protein
MHWSFIHEDDIKAPENMIAMGDVFIRAKNQSYDAMICSEPLITPWSPDIHSTKTPNRKQPAYIAHHGRCNRAFVDGHLESEDMRRNFEGRDDQLARLNNDNLPHRDLSW